MDFSGSRDSAAAMVTISMPPNANATASRPAAIPAIPLGANPSPSPSRWVDPTGSVPGSRPNTSSTPMTRNPTITATFSAANQNSNSPKFATFARLTTAKKVTNTSATTHCGTPPGIHEFTMLAAPVISTPSTMISMNQ